MSFEIICIYVRRVFKIDLHAFCDIFQSYGSSKYKSALKYVKAYVQYIDFEIALCSFQTSTSVSIGISSFDLLMHIAAHVLGIHVDISPTRYVTKKNDADAGTSCIWRVRILQSWQIKWYSDHSPQEVVATSREHRATAPAPGGASLWCSWTLGYFSKPTTFHPVQV